MEGARPLIKEVIPEDVEQKNNNVIMFLVICTIFIFDRSQSSTEDEGGAIHPLRSLGDRMRALGRKRTYLVIPSVVLFTIVVSQAILSTQDSERVSEKELEDISESIRQLLRIVFI